MGRTYDELTPALIEFIERQHVFFVATAPTDGGHVNVSPKGYDTLRIDDGTLSYLDLTGSGIETIAHLRDNGRITLMWCAFSGKPRIVRVQGRGKAISRHDPDFARLAARFPDDRGVCAVITVRPDRIADSCGYSVPFMEYLGERDRLHEWADQRSDDELETYRHDRNATSIDGLPAWKSGIGDDC